MTIPPFPSQDLAKLVLGYLADEQLMTAYDEFLQASPYLDALRNEYDRLFMTSLKNILAEYRAVKIYVETCKPLCLRKRLSQCTNMLEIVKFLVCNIDMNKTQDICSDKVRHNISKRNSCDDCNASSCQCKSAKNPQGTASQSTSQIEATSIENSIQTTLLSDLPGHVSVRKRNVKLLDKDSKSSTSASNFEPSDNDVISIQCDDSSPVKINQDKLVTAVTEEPAQKIDEFNDDLKIVSDKNREEKSRCNSNLDAANTESRSSTGTFQDFASGIRDNATASVPDSSTSESIQIPASKDTGHVIKTVDVPKTKKKVVKTAKPNLSSQLNKETLKYVNISPNPVGLLKPIPDEHKIKIISDIKVEKDKVQAATLKNATSTPLAQMQTILINGTPVYKNKYISRFNYTKDEIMAMPTIIIVPTSATTQTIQSLPTNSQNCNSLETHTVSSSAQSLEPLIIDVAANNSVINNLQSVELVNPPNIVNGNSLITTVENIKNASVPKDSFVSCENKTNTPQLLPPVRKSSSTPRRTSHVRVLDFTTPRRILHETLNENLPNQKSNNSAELILSDSQNVVYTTANSSKGLVAIEDGHNDNNNVINSPTVVNGPTKENNSTKKLVPIKKSNWDADLRAMAIGNVTDPSIPFPTMRPKSKRKSRKKKPPDDNQACKKVNRKKSSPSKSKKKICNSAEEKVSIVSEVTADIVEGTVEVPVKPTINIISGQEWGATSSQIVDINSKNEVDTPETERLSLQNEIGAKLNISDLLETPYKQALYDIQMETPRFLGPDLPHDPMASDIKITNIPTPRFLATPNPKPTPSSYSSRPTDYSSGGSYYKPDDLDYIPAPEDLGCPVTSSMKNTYPAENNQKSNESNKKDKLSCVKSRPVRQCTKNVSYVNSPYANNKTKDVDRLDDCSMCSSDTISIDNNSFESKSDRDTRNINITKVSKPKVQEKSMSKKRISSSKVINSPVKKVKPKAFLKIKPRRPTPPRDQSKSKRKTQETSSSSSNRKRTNSKEKQLKATPLIAAVPTKSRRKSSTPRKLHCTKMFHSESSGHDSPEIMSKNKSSVHQNPNVGTQDSDTEQLALRWSDDGSQDEKTKEQINPTSLTNECDDILKIKEYIETSVSNKLSGNENEGSLHVHLIKRGFDAETAKIIERDLLDSPNMNTVDSNTLKTNAVDSNTVESTNIKPTEEADNKKDESENTLESNLSISDNPLIIQDVEDIEYELSVHECNEETDNYVTFIYDDTKNVQQKSPVQLKDKFCMEVCMDDIAIRLRATPFIVSFEEDPANADNINYSFRETEIAVSSISNIDRLYTPLKESVKAQCYEIFNSTLTSLDTPLKVDSPKKNDHDLTVTEIVLEVEKVEVRQAISQVKDKTEGRKRKRNQSGNTSDESLSNNKKTRPETHKTEYLLNTTNMQNIDIESVLSQLHGP